MISSKTKNVVLLLLILYSASLLNGQVIVGFSASQLSGCGSFQVNFTDLSHSTTGNIVSRKWDLGGVTATTQNPGRIFGSPGKYTICLTVEDDAGNIASECRTDYIVVHHLPQPNFSADAAEGCGSMLVTFEDLTTSEALIEEWTWGTGGSAGVIIDDGSLPVIQSTYSVPDNYTVSLTVKDINGCLNTIAKTDFLTLHESPHIELSADQTYACLPPMIVNFSNLKIENHITYRWDFGNGNLFVGPQPPPITYNNLGVYDVSVMATNNLTGCSDTLVLDRYINVGNEVSISYSDRRSCIRKEIRFTDNSIVPADSILWEFGDGVSSYSSNPIHQYDSAGCFLVKLTRWVDGCSNTATIPQCILINKLPSADYSSLETLGCSLPYATSFSGTSTSIVNWNWDFGDGTSSTLQNPTHEYTSYGEFPVEVTVVDAFGCSSSILKDTVTIKKVNASIVPNRFFDCSPLSGQLEENSISISPIVEWDWTVSTSSLPGESHSFTDSMPLFTLVDTGRYTIRLIVKNTFGCKDTSYYDDLIGVGLPPVIDIEATPTVSCLESAVSFSDLSSNYSDEWMWDFGDGVTSSQQSPWHEFRDTGKFDISLTAFHLGCKAEKTFFDFVEIRPPRAIFALDRWCRYPYRVDFNEISIGADRFLWDFDVPNTDTDTSHQPDPTFIFPDTGVYTIKLIVFNDEVGCRDSTEFPITIADPKADFVLSENRGCVPMTVDVTNQSQSAAQYSWTVGEGACSNHSSAEPQLIFDSSGIYNDIKLVITDVNNCQDSMVISNPVMVNEIFVDFDVDPSLGCAPLDIHLTDHSTDLFGNIIEWDWLIGGDTQSITAQHPIVTLDSAGLFNVQLVATDDWGCHSSKTVHDAINVALPVANFFADTLGCTERQIQFTNTSIGKSLSYFWDFGDGSSSTERDPVHFYTQEGLFSVCLTIKNPFGCDSTLCLTDYINIADPVASFEYDVSYGQCPPLVVNFTNLSTNATSVNWEFGDESGQSTLENPPHVYTTPGTYDVTLIAIANEQCQDTITLEDLIHLDGPIGEFNYTVDSSCVPFEVTFKGTSIEDYDYIWDFGNGIVDSTLQVSSDSLVYTYTEPGKYVPKLVFVNSDNCLRVLELSDTIYLASLDVDFAAIEQKKCGPLETQFFNLTNSSAPISSFSWNFPGTTLGQSNVLEPLVQFDTIGQYEVQLIVDNGYCKDTLIRPAFIELGAIPVAEFALSDSIGCPTLAIDFSDQSSVEQSYIKEWQWSFGNEGTSSGTNSQFVFTEEGYYDIQLKVTSEVDCVDSTIHRIRVLPAPEALIKGYPEICINEKLQINAEILSDSTTYHWMDNPGLSCTDCLDPFVIIPSTTTFSLFTENGYGCRDTASVTIEVGPHEAPIITLSADTTVCLNDPVQLFVSGGSGVEYYNWNSSAPGLTCYTSCNNPIAMPLESTTYSVTVTNEFDCQNEDTVRVSIIDQFQPFAGEDRIICEGDTVHLNASMGNTPVWLNTEGLNCTYCYDPIAEPEETTIYPVKVTTDLGCEIYDSVMITIVDIESVDAGADTIICLGEPAQLQGRGLGQISWSPSASLDHFDVLRPEAFPAYSTSYKLRVEQGDCVLTDSVFVDVVEQAEITAHDTTICEGETVELMVEGLAGSYIWEDSPLLSALNIPNPVVTLSSTTTFNLQGLLSGCTPDSAALTVTVIPAPEVWLPPTYRFFSGQSLHLNALAADSSIYSYAWLNGADFTCRSCPNPGLQPDSTDTYTLMVTDEETGCIDSFSTTVKLMQSCPEDLIAVPNIFTPNGDGENDELQLYPSTSMRSITSFRIFNRWGALVFETTDMYESWDGYFKGKLAPSGVYIYVLEAPCEVIDGEMMKTGDITLLR